MSGSQVLTRAELADLVERHAGQLVQELRADRSVGGPSGLRTAIWTKVGEEEGQSYSWPEGTDHFLPFEVWTTTTRSGEVRIGLGRVTVPQLLYGRERFWWLAFSMLGDQKQRPIVVFNEADDHETSRDLIAAIKGKGTGGRSMFTPGDELPDFYDSMPVDVFRNRISGPYAPNRQAVVVPGEDRDVMLDHALIQLLLRH